ncbi:MAG: pyridoxal-phosphate dependent enzyme [Chloroflexota bacterium]
MIPIEWVFMASERIKDQTVRTPVTYDKELNIFLKWENKQITGSFKIRGALNKVLSLENWEQKQGLVTASAGNHGQGLALSGRIIDAPVLIFVSDQAVSSKVDAMRKLGAEVCLVKGGYGLVEQAALDYASQNNATYISPYNDGQIIAGQGTIGLELIQELTDEQKYTWIIPVGGGGLISGIGAVIRHFKMHHRLVGVQSEASAFTYSLYHKGSQSNVPDLPTLADGLSGPMQAGSITFPMLMNLVDDIITVTEIEIAQGIAYAWHRYHEIIEGSSATALAAVLTGKIKSPAIVIISGGNIQSEIHEQICQKYEEII